MKGVRAGRASRVCAQGGRLLCEAPAASNPPSFLAVPAIIAKLEFPSPAGNEGAARQESKLQQTLKLLRQGRDVARPHRTAVLLLSLLLLLLLLGRMRLLRLMVRLSQQCNVPEERHVPPKGLRGSLTAFEVSRRLLCHRRRHARMDMSTLC